MLIGSVNGGVVIIFFVTIENVVINIINLVCI